MKKLLVLALVLGLASAASAGIVLVSPDPTTLDIVTDPIDEPQPMAAFFLATTGEGSLDAGTMLYSGSLSAITDYTGADPDLTAAINAVIGGESTRIDFVEFADGTPPPQPPVVGKLATYSVTGLLTAYLIDPDVTQVLSSVVIPEPTTIALLGLGGLLLRRRK